MNAARLGPTLNMVQTDLPPASVARRRNDAPHEAAGRTPSLPGPWDLRFPASVEQQFLQETAPRRVALVNRRSLVVVLMFSGMLLSDWFMVPDRFNAALVLRLAVFMPLYWLMAMLFARQAATPSRDWILCAGGCLTVLLNILLIVPSHSPWACTYLATLSIIVVCWDSILRPGFGPALAHSSFTILSFALALTLWPDHGGTLAVPISVMLVASMVFSLYGSYTLEKAEREAYGIGLKQRALRDQLQDAHERLTQQARLDPLTQIPNRRHFDETLPTVCTTPATEVCVMVLDVDHFKPYNDHYGHPAGDRCLHAIARALAQCVRQPQDLLARLGGEEFGVVLRHTTLQKGMEVAERMRSAVRAQALTHSFRPDQVGVVTVSLGLAAGRPSNMAEMQALIEAADLALYQAKAQGRDRFSVTMAHLVPPSLSEALHA